MRANHKTGRQSEGKMKAEYGRKIKERLGFGRKAEGDKEDDRGNVHHCGVRAIPPREYEKTRHNVGFEVIDVLADRLGTTVEEKKFKGMLRKRHHRRTEGSAFKAPDLHEPERRAKRKGCG